MLVVQEISKSFDRVHAVKDVSFIVEPGQVFGLLGENGAGKTTLMRILATVLTPTSGTAIVAGSDIRKDPIGVRSKVGALFEGGLYDRLTARENVLFFSRLHGVPDQITNERMERLFELVGLELYRDRRASELSKGNRQKVALVRSVIHEPQVLLFDEPTSGLDVTASRAFYEFVSQQRKMGKVIVFSSHIMTEIERVCDRIGVIRSGELIVEDSLDGLRRTYGNDLEEVFVGLIRGGQA